MSDDEAITVLLAVHTMSFRECFLRLDIGYQQYAELKKIANLCLKKKP